jgi:hypothetical protein
VVTPSQFAGTAQNTAAAFKVPDLVALMAALRSRGVVFEECDLPGIKTTAGEFEYAGYRVAWFKPATSSRCTRCRNTPDEPSLA